MPVGCDNGVRLIHIQGLGLIHKIKGEMCYATLPMSQSFLVMLLPSLDHFYLTHFFLADSSSTLWYDVSVIGDAMFVVLVCLGHMFL